jgi:ferredoxin-NADP reductase
MQVSEIYGVLKGKIKRTKDIQSFRFKLDEEIDFLPGQFMEVIFQKQDNELRHFLSFSSSPLRNYIEFTKRLSQSKFSQKLNELASGDKILLKLPFGDCIYKKEEYKKIAFIIGGIGITPVISILEYVVDKDLDTDCLLIYSNRSEEEIAFKKELDGWSRKIDLKVLYLVTEQEPESNNIHKGFINHDFLFSYKEELQERINFVFGPPKMVTAIVELLKQIGIDGDKIISESFIGY